MTLKENPTTKERVQFIEIAFFQLRHRINEHIHRHPEAEQLKRTILPIKECVEAAKALMGLWACISTIPAENLKRKYETLLSVLHEITDTNIHWDIGVTAAESTCVSRDILEIANDFVNFAENVQHLLSGTAVLVTSACIGLTMLKWLFAALQKVPIKHFPGFIQYIVRWIAPLGLSSSGAATFASVLLFCVSAGVTWYTFKDVILPAIAQLHNR
jgi:hypothetical protein